MRGTHQRPTCTYLELADAALAVVVGAAIGLVVLIAIAEALP